MMRLTLKALLVAMFTSSVCSQDLLWRVLGVGDHLRRGMQMARLGDVNGDGWDDIVEIVDSDALGVFWQAIAITSGRDGMPLAYLGRRDSDSLYIMIHSLGDMNGDGIGDYGVCVQCSRPTPRPKEYQIRSGRDHALIRSIAGPQRQFWGNMACGHIDVNGDGRNDIIIGDTRASPGGTIYVHDNSGVELYRVVNQNLSWLVGVWLAPLGGDLDQDGIDDFLIAGPDTSLRGVVIVASGRNGAFLQVGYGEIPYDKLSCCAGTGDLDGDGVPDYAGGGYWGYPVVRTFSGATGQALWTYRLPTTYATDMGGTPLVASHDLDQDGVNDLFVGNAPHQVHALSGRDGSLLFTYYGHGPSVWTQIGTGDALTVLNPPPGEQYPVLVFSEHIWFPYPSTSWFPPGRIWAIRTSPLGVRAYGVGSAAPGESVPRMGMYDPPGPSMRFTLSDAPAGVLAVLSLGFHDQAFGPMALPASLAPIGLPGMTLLCAPEVLFPAVPAPLGVGGPVARCELPLTADPVNGCTVFAQWHWLDPAMPWRHGSTAGHRLRVR